MKAFRLIPLVMVIGCSCGQQQEAAVKAFIPGRYARSVQNEFSEGRDTLVIENIGDDNYSIQHRMTYQRITNGKAGAPEKKNESWMALWDEKSGALVEQRRGRLITFQPSKRTLMVESSLYQKTGSF